MLIMAGVVLNGCFLAMFFAPNRKHKKSTQWNNFDFSLIRNAQYVLFLFSFIFVYVQTDFLYQLSPARAVSKGLTKLQGSALMSFMGIGSIVSRIMISIIFSSNCMSSNQKQGIVYVTGFFLMFCFTLLSCFVSSSFIGLAVCIVVCGVTLGMYTQNKYVYFLTIITLEVYIKVYF